MAKKATDPGRYRERVTVCYNMPTTADDGQLIEVPVTLYRPWAEVLPVSGREFVQGQQMVATVTHRVRMWSDSYSRTITPRHWIIRSDGTRLNIVRVFDSRNRRRELELECIEQVAGA